MAVVKQLVLQYQPHDKYYISLGWVDDPEDIFCFWVCDDAIREWWEFPEGHDFLLVIRLLNRPTINSYPYEPGLDNELWLKDSKGVAHSVHVDSDIWDGFFRPGHAEGARHLEMDYEELDK